MARTIIFDRSAFHGSRFDLLSASKLLALTKESAITVHHSEAFLEETIAMYEKDHNRAELRRQIRFILEICNGRWFRSLGAIWDLELRQNHGPSADVFEDEPVRRTTEANILEAVFKMASGLDSAMHYLRKLSSERSKRDSTRP